MTVHAATPVRQLTLDFEPGLVERHATLLDCLRAAVYGGQRGLKGVAIDMDMSSGELGRKLNTNPDDVRRFTVEDLENYVQRTGDTTPVLYLALRYLPSDEDRRHAAVGTAQRLMAELAAVLPALKAAA